MIERMYLFNGAHRDGKTWTVEQAFSWGRGTKIISMNNDEDAYLFSMQLLLGEANIIPFQKWHDDAWNKVLQRDQTFDTYMAGPIFCTASDLIELTTCNWGDLKVKKRYVPRADLEKDSRRHMFI